MSFFSTILLLGYFVLLVFFTYKCTFFESKFGSKKTISLLLGLKLLAGLFYIFIHKNLIDGGDIFQYFEDSFIILDELKTNPINYLKLVFFPNNVAIPHELAEPINTMGYWSDTGAYMLVRFNALIGLISFGNIYIHGLFAAFFSFIGCFLLAKVFEDNVKTNALTFYSIFLSPSLLFWTAGMHKEFISTLALGLILYHFFKLIKRINNPINILGFMTGLVLFFLTRNYMLLALVPSMLAFFIYKAFHIRFRRAVFFSLLLFISFLNYQKIPSYNKTGFEVIVEKRKQFEDLKNGNTYIELDNIEPNFVSLMSNSPKALFNTLLRPHILEVYNLFTAFICIENIFILLLITFAFLQFHKLRRTESNFAIFMLLYSIFLLLIIGWIVPNIGAIIRYRSIALLILIPTLFFVAGKNEKLNAYVNQITKK